MTTRTNILFCLVINIILIKSTNAENNPYIFDFATNQKYSTVKCIQNILTKYFACGTLTTFVNVNANVDRLIKTANEKTICHCIIVRSFQDRNWFIWTELYVITANSLLELWFGMFDLTRDVFWNPRAKFIIQVDYLEDEKIEKVFKMLLKYRMFDVVFLQNTKEDSVIYTYRPFDNHSCGKHFDKVINLGTCENAETIVNYFPNKVLNRMKNCTFKVVANDDVPNFISKESNYTVYGKFVPGLEQYVLDTIADQEGFFLDYDVLSMDATFGIVLPNRTATGLLNYIDRDKADIAAGGYVLMKNRVELFDYIWGFNYAAYYLYTPAAAHEIWRRVYREFGITTWSLIAASIVFVIIVGHVLKKILADETYSILNLWGYFFGNTGTGISKHKKFRLIIIWWAWFTFCISNFYNTALVGLVSVHVHEKPHSLSVGNLTTLAYKPCISDNSRMLFQYAFNQSLPVGKAIHNCIYTDSSLQYVATTKKYYAIEMEYSYKLKEYQYIDDFGNPELNPWLFSSTNVIVMYLARGFPFIEKFQDYAHRMYEAGLITNHLKTINLKSYSVVQKHAKPFKMTSLLNLRMHFGILFLGVILSFICFLLEIWYNYIKEDEKNKRTVRINKLR